MKDLKPSKEFLGLIVIILIVLTGMFSGAYVMQEQEHRHRVERLQYYDN